MSISEDLLDVIRKGMRTAKVPTQFDRVFKDECMLSFQNPFSPGGLFVSLTTWQGYGTARLGAYAAAKGETLFLHEAWTRVPKEKAKTADGAEEEPTRLAIGVEGGFSGGDNHDIVKEHHLAVLPAGWRSGDAPTLVPLSDALPTLVLDACNAVVASEGAAFKEEVAAWEDDDADKDSRFAADLPQVADAPRIPADPAAWACGVSGDKENLWLNLSTGFIGGGRKNWDGSGGSGGALTHFEDTGRQYPLVVKLGTITPSGADVYSYHPEEDRSCRDPKLAEHLAHFGIDIMQQEKTVSTTKELGLKLNLQWDSSRILENDKELEPASGPGFQGLTNLGNSCYMAASLQALATVPEVAARYAGEGGEGLLASAGDNPADDLLAQLAKVVQALTGGAGGALGEEAEDPSRQVRPQMLKHVVGKGNKEFSSVRQQDAQEYFSHLLDRVNRAEAGGKARLAGGAAPTLSAFEYDLVERVECQATGRVRYTTQRDNMLGLGVPRPSQEDETSDAKRVRREEGSEVEGEQSPPPPLPVVAFDELVSKFLQPGMCFCTSNHEHLWHTHTHTHLHTGTVAFGSVANATTTTRIKTFPKCLAVYLRRYYVSDKWEPKKMEVEVPMPEQLDLSCLRGTDTLKDGEVPLPDTDASAAPAAEEVTPDDVILQSLVSMGFGANGCAKACVAVKNASLEAATEWVFAHMEDTDFDAPPAAAAAPAAVGGSASFNEADVQMLTGLGFTERFVKKALGATGGSAERAADWLFSHEDDGGDDDTAAAAAPESAGASGELSDGAAQYTLTAMVSHIGKNTACGHYVAHVKKDGEWYFFNDDKVAKSKDPPYGLAYIYLYRRNDA